MPMRAIGFGGIEGREEKEWGREAKKRRSTG